MQLIFTFLLINHAPILHHNRPECSLRNYLLKMIQPNELQIGSIIEYKSSNKWTVKIVDIFDLMFIDSQLEDFNDCHRAIPLTEKILVEWCGFESMNDSMGFRLQLDKEIAFRVYLANDNDGNEVWSHNNCDIFQRDSGDDFHQVCLNIIPLYLHQLQMLIQSLTNQPLKITLK